MAIKEISYERVLNLGNFETVRMGGIVVINEGDDIEQEQKKLKDFVLDHLLEEIKEEDLLDNPPSKNVRIPKKKLKEE